ncbi:hypothetical protein EWB00_010697, partial [Schistosoma japonicum]
TLLKNSHRVELSTITRCFSLVSRHIQNVESTGRLLSLRLTRTIQPPVLTKLRLVLRLVQE